MYCFVSSENWLRSPTAVPVLNAVTQARILLRHSSRSSLVSVTLICEINSHGARDKTQNKQIYRQHGIERLQNI